MKVCIFISLLDQCKTIFLIAGIAKSVTKMGMVIWSLSLQFDPLMIVMTRKQSCSTSSIMTVASLKTTNHLQSSYFLDKLERLSKAMGVPFLSSFIRCLSTDVERWWSKEQTARGILARVSPAVYNLDSVCHWSRRGYHSNGKRKRLNVSCMGYFGSW